MNDWRNRLFHDTLSSLVGEIMEEFIAFTKDLKKTYRGLILQIYRRQKV